MPKSSDPRRVPSYRRHKPTGQAVVTLNGHDHYLGKWNSAASRVEYDRLIAEWLAAGRSSYSRATDLTVSELALAYWKWAKGYYQKNGRPTGSIPPIRVAIRLLRQLYGRSRAVDFGPLALEALQQRLVTDGKARNTVNEIIAIVRRVFRWAVAKQLIPAGVHQALVAVPGLKQGRSMAREPRPVRPVAEAVVTATLAHLPVVVADMVRFQRLTGCRPAEVCILRPQDVDTSGDVWIYRPESHKTEHHGRERIICIGPQAQDVLCPYLLRPADSYCFSPAESERRRNARRRENRRSLMTPSQARRQPKGYRHDGLGNRYSTAGYRRCIQRAVVIANRAIQRQREKEGLKPGDSELLAAWSPNQLRHSAATEIRKQFGLEAAQVALGHASADITQVYAERDLAKAVEVMRRIG